MVSIDMSVLLPMYDGLFGRIDEMAINLPEMKDPVYTAAYKEYYEYLQKLAEVLKPIVESKPIVAEDCRAAIKTLDRACMDLDSDFRQLKKALSRLSR